MNTNKMIKNFIDALEDEDIDYVRALCVKRQNAIDEANPPEKLPYRECHTCEGDGHVYGLFGGATCMCCNGTGKIFYLTPT